ncbi:MAG: terpene cyclase/mutase family protein [Planctomycetes bacterium]|nr:terpene cyclase/mutase family protein [Planctomycetota bacterium]
MSARIILKLLPLLFAVLLSWQDKKSDSELYTDDVKNSVLKGLEFLSKNQNSNGSWGTGRDSKEDHVGVTALAGIAFLSYGNTPLEGKYSDDLQRAINYTITKQTESGLISCSRTLSAPMYSHAFATLFLAEASGMSNDGSTKIKPALKKAVRLIVHAQNSTGGWRYTPGATDADLSVTICQIIALKAAEMAGIKIPDSTLERATKYILSCDQKTNGFRYQHDWGHASMALTGGALSALSFLSFKNPNIVENAKEYLKQYEPFGKKRLYGHFSYSLFWATLSVNLTSDSFWKEYYSSIKKSLMSRYNEEGFWDDKSVGDIYGTAMAINILNMALHYLPVYLK